MYESEYVDYDGLVELARQTAIEHAKEWIPKLCEALKRENPEMSKEDIRETVTNDCRDFWSRATISKFMPDEYKDPQKREAGKKGRESQRLEEPIPAGMNPGAESGRKGREKRRLEEPILAGTVSAENDSVSQTEQDSESFENAANTIRDMAIKEKEKDSNRKKDANGFKVILLTYPKVVEDSSSSHNKEDKRPPISGTIDETGSDLGRIKDMGVEHIIFGYSFLPTGGDVIVHFLSIINVLVFRNHGFEYLELFHRIYYC